MIRAHAAAVLAFYAARQLRCYDGVAGRKADGTEEDPVFPYAVLFMASPVSSTDTFGHARERAEIDLTVSYHGESPDQARWAAERVAALAGARLQVTSRQCVTESVFTGLLRPDTDDPEQVIYSGADGFTITSYPAA